LRTRPAILATLALALSVAACSGGVGAATGTASPGTARSIVIGATLSLTGSLSAPGAPLEAGYQQEIAAVNAAGGITVDGTRERLRLVVLDNRSDPAAASSQARQLVRRDHAVALLGFATAQIVLPTALVAEQLRVPFLTSLMPVRAFASGDKAGWKYSWDFFYDERQQATRTASALASVPGSKKVALFTDSEPDAVAERALYTAAFRADGLDLVGDYTVPAGTTDFSSFIADARASGAQLLAGQLASADGVALWKEVKSAGLDPKAAFLAQAPDAASGTQSLGALAAGTLSPGYWSPSQASPGQLAAIAATLGKSYPDEQDYATAAVGYAVAQVLTDALTRSGSTSAGKLTAAISRTSARTTAGLITFSPSTHTAITPYYITQWQHGRLVQVQPPASGTALVVPAAGLG
jgi:branched-chain amino acid transport system substrate-binding protein